MFHDGLMHFGRGNAARTLRLHGGEREFPRLCSARLEPGQERAHRSHHACAETARIPCYPCGFRCVRGATVLGTYHGL